MAAQAEAANGTPHIMFNSYYNHQSNGPTRARQNDLPFPMMINSFNGQPIDNIDHCVRALGYLRGGAAIPNDLAVDLEAANRGRHAPVNNDAGAGFNAGGGHALFGNNADADFDGYPNFNDYMMRAGLVPAAAKPGMDIGGPVFQTTAGGGLHGYSMAEAMKRAKVIKMAEVMKMAEAMKMVEVMKMAEVMKMGGGGPVSQMTAGGGLHEYIAEVMKMGGDDPASQENIGAGGFCDPAIMKETCGPENIKYPGVSLQDILANFGDNGTYGAFQDDKFTGYYGGSDNDQHDWAEEFGVVEGAGGTDLMEG